MMKTLLASFLFFLGILPETQPAEMAPLVRTELQPIEHMAITSGSIEPPPLDLQPVLRHANRAEVECLASAVHHEARGEPDEGQIAVVEVILARRKNRRWPDNACRVVAQRAQFSFVRSGNVPATPLECREKHIALVRQVLMGRSVGLHQATHFHAEHVHPKWRHSYRQIRQIGRHIFYG